jgi:hypothetical protein
MEAYLSTLKVWDIVDKSYTGPTPADASKLTSEERKAMLDFKREKGVASGQIWLAVEDEQQVHLKDDKGDPAAMWEALKKIHVQQRPGTRFNAYNNLFSIVKGEEESLTSLRAELIKLCRKSRIFAHPPSLLMTWTRSFSL